MTPADGVPLIKAELSDRQRVAVLLQAGSLLSHLQVTGDGRVRCWEHARIDESGMVRGLDLVPGRSSQHPQARLRGLARSLFGAGREIAGRGEARRVVRRLMRLWSCDLLPLAPDEMVRQVLEEAEFLWSPALGSHRATLAAEHVRDGSSHLWVAGPSWFRHALLSRGAILEEVRDVLQSRSAARIWKRVGAKAQGEAVGGRWRASVAAWKIRSREGVRNRLACAEALIAVGRFSEALSEVRGARGARARVLRARSLAGLGRSRRAAREISKIDLGEASGKLVLDAASVAVPQLTRIGRYEEASGWSARADHAARTTRQQCLAKLLRFDLALAANQLEVAAEHLEGARPARRFARLAPRWLTARARLAEREGQWSAVTENLRQALGGGRRTLGPMDAGNLWRALAVARCRTGDLAGSERAVRHALRLQREALDSDGRARSLATLAEVRLRRSGANAGRDVLHLLAAVEPRGGECAMVDRSKLRIRHELARGRPDAAAEAARASLADLSGSGSEESQGQLRALLARALGWQGLGEEAARILDTLSDARAPDLEPEEVPALWALAGRRRRAVEEIGSGPDAAAWSAVLAGRRPGDRDFREAAGLGSYRAARLVFDLEAVAAGLVPAEIVARAAATLRRSGAAPLAARMERDRSRSWPAVANFLSAKRSDRGAVARLFREAGYGLVHLKVTRGSDGYEEVILDGPGGSQDLSIDAAEGSVVLRAPSIDATLQVLAEVVARELAQLVGALPERSPGRSRQFGMVGRSRNLRQALERLRLLAQGDLPLLIRGETGTGKELAARAVHADSGRSCEKFLPFNCAAVSRDLLMSDLFGHVRGAYTGAVSDRAGVFESAGGGTVFLDEVGDLPLRVQGFLLRVLQEREVRRVGESRSRRVDARVVSATHRDLEHLVRQGRFRSDLYFRLRGASVELPPLRDRGKDILLLARHFLGLSGRGQVGTLTDDALLALQEYHWPGNVRELKNVLAVAATMAGSSPICREHLELPKPRSPFSCGYHEKVRDYRRSLVRDAMIASDGNGAAAARRLGLTRQALSYLVRSLEVEI